jgi:arsenite-transporting ATPase
LIKSIEEQYEASMSNPRQQQQTILVGGKGGVGKTTTSAAIAIEIASQHPEWKVLIVSTDPAHSLGDALDIDLSSSRGRITPIYDDPFMTPRQLYAQEVNADLALEEFRSNMNTILDTEQLSQTLGVSVELLESFGINELQSVIQNPPPGLDELVALSNVFASSSSSSSSSLPIVFDVVVVDTAPTGHTLRLLALPQFLNGFVGKLIQFRRKLTGIATTLQSMMMMGGSNNNQRTDQNSKKDLIDTAMNRIEEFQHKVQYLRTTLQNKDWTKFVVVTVPTQLAVAESKRLIQELQQPQNNIAVTDVIINQCITTVGETHSSSKDDNNDSNNNPMMKYYHRRVAGQQKWIQALHDAVQRVSESNEYQQNIGTDDNNNNNSNHQSATIPSKSIEITEVPFFDVELVGIPALGYIGSQVYMNNPKFDHLLLKETTSAGINTPPPKLVICGGKGGVGKTTSSASLAVSMAMSGHKVALISTDPAHSLGDAVQMKLTGGQLQDCPLIGVPAMMMDGGNEMGSLSVLEIDPTATLNQFKDVVNQLMGNSNDVETSNNALRDTLKDLQDIFDTLPAGTDEVVALAKIVNLVKKGGFDRIVLDTAPTGHTLRMLSTPGFLADLIERLLRISEKINSNSMVQLMLLGSTTAQRLEEIQKAVETAKSTLLSFQFQMYDLEDLFANAQQTEFMIVTVPTELTVRESIRLLNDLTFESPDLPIKVRNVIVNQVLNDDSDSEITQSFLSHLSATQSSAITELRHFIDTYHATIGEQRSIEVTMIPYLDTEPRGVFGLKALAFELVKQESLQKQMSTLDKNS